MTVGSTHAQWLPSGIPRVLLWVGVGVCAALSLLLLAAKVELVQGQIADVPASATVVGALLVGIFVGKTAAGERLVEVATRPRSLVALSIAAFVLLAVGTLVVFGTTPLSGDEQAHLFQARLFSQFKIVAAYPPDLLDRIVSSGYQNGLILVASDGRAMSVYWPGWALLMTPFVWIGAPWLLGPAMASLGLYIIGRLASLLSGARAAAIAVLLAVTSGSFIVTGMSLYPAGGHLTLSLLYAWLLLRGGRRDALLAGLVGGLALNLHNPAPHTLFAIPWLVWLALDATRRRRLIWLAIGYAPWIVVFFGWLLVTSSLHVQTPDGGNFWHDRLPLLINFPTPGIIGLRFWELVRLWIWSAPGILVLALLGWRRTLNPGARLLGICFALTVVLFVMFPAGQGLGYGARYYQSAWGALPILAALLLLSPGEDSLRRIAVTAAVAGLILVVPLQIAYAHDNYVGAQAGELSINALAAPGVNLYFIAYSDGENPSAPLADDPSLHGTLVLLSEGPASDQALVDRDFPGARLVVRTSFGSGYARP